MAKEIQFGEDVRRKLEAGVDKLANTVKSNSRTEGQKRSSREIFRRAAHHERRCDDRERCRSGRSI